MVTYFLYKKLRYKPAIGGPIVNGILNIPSRKPIACEASAGPTISKAMGPSRHTKMPSQIPITKLITIIPPKDLENGIHTVETPRITKASCCIFIRLTHGKSATFPHIILPTPDVILRQRIGRLPSCPGKLSAMYLG